MTPRPRQRRSGLVAAAALLVSLVCLWIAPSPRALYVMPDVENVPVDRVIANLEKLASARPDDVAIRMNLARAHGMAYAKGAESLQVPRKNDAEVYLGPEPKHVPFAPVAGAVRTDTAAAKAHLQRAIEQYEIALKLAPSNLTLQLGHAWCVDRSGDKARAIAEYRAVIAAAWEQEKTLGRAGPGWHSIVDEAAGYLLPLLDPTRDAAEILTLQQRRAHISTITRMITPIAIPLRDGLTAFDVSDASARVRFDADGSGIRKSWTWIGRAAGWLVYDQRGTGEITTALEMFGSVTFWMFWPNGYEALRVLDDDGDGSLAGDELRHLAIWRDANQNGVSDKGEVRPLAAWGIVSLATRYEYDAAHPDEIAWSPRGVTLSDGSTRPTWDVVLHQWPSMPVRFGR